MPLPPAIHTGSSSSQIVACSKSKIVQPIARFKLLIVPPDQHPLHPPTRKALIPSSQIPPVPFRTTRALPHDTLHYHKNRKAKPSHRKVVPLHPRGIEIPDKMGLWSLPKLALPSNYLGKPPKAAQQTSAAKPQLLLDKPVRQLSHTDFSNASHVLHDLLLLPCGWGC